MKALQGVKKGCGLLSICVKAFGSVDGQWRGVGGW